MIDRLAAIRDRLTEDLNPSRVEIEDQSHLHAGHAGAKDGRGHFKVMIEAEVFAGKTPIQRHRMVYDALDTLMQTDIHALSIDARTPGDAQILTNS